MGEVEIERLRQRAQTVASRLQASLDRVQGQAQLIQSYIETEKRAVEETTEALKTDRSASLVLGELATRRQEEFRKSLETLVTQGLQSVFDDSFLKFHIVEEVKRNKPTVTFEIESLMEGEVVRTSVLDSRGGGLASVVGFLVRLSVLLLSGNRRILLLDETFAQLSEGFEPRMAEWVADLCHRTGVQIVMVTHSDAYSEHADVVYRTSQEAGVTDFERVK